MVSSPGCLVDGQYNGMTSWPVGKGHEGVAGIDELRATRVPRLVSGVGWETIRVIIDSEHVDGLEWETDEPSR